MTNPGPIPPKPGPPSSPPGPPNVLNQPKPEPNAEIVKLPPALQHLKEQVRLKGEVIKTNTDGTVRIRTEQGDIDVRLQQTPAKGEKVNVEIDPGRPPQTARVTIEQTAETRPPPSTETEAPPPPAPPRTTETPVEIEVRPEKPPAAPPVEEAVRIEQVTLQQALELIEPLDTIVSATKEALDLKTQITVTQVQTILNEDVNIITPQETIPGAPAVKITTTGTLETAQPVPVKPGVLVSVTPESVVILQPAAGITPPPAGPGITVPAQSPSVQITTPLTSAVVTNINVPEIPVTELPKIAEQVAERLKNILTQPVEPNVYIKNNPVGALTGVVIGQTLQKLPVIAIFPPNAPPSFETASFFVVSTPSPALVPGTEITLMPQQPGHVTAPPAGFTALPLPFFTPGPWPLMDEVNNALMASLPQAARAFTTMSPSPANPAQMGPAALFFIAAVRGGDLTQWLGDRAIDLIRRGGKSGLLSRVSAEGSILNRLSSDPVSQEWRGMNLPLYWDNQMHKIALYYKHEGEDSGRFEKNGGQVRFLFDLRLDNMGKVQLDGLFRPKRLDLIVRSEQAFSQSMQMQMRRAYVNALEQTQVSGELSFQNKPEQWVTISGTRRGFGTSA